MDRFVQVGVAPSVSRSRQSETGTTNNLIAVDDENSSLATSATRLSESSLCRMSISSTSVDANCSGTANDNDEAKNNTISNPWPYLKYWKFLGIRGSSTNLEFQCLLCKPIVKKLSTNIKSHYNLKKHIEQMYSHKLIEYQTCIDANKTLRKKRKESPNDDDDDVGPMAKKLNLRQLLLGETLAKSNANKLSQKVYEEKVSYR